MNPNNSRVNVHASLILFTLNGTWDNPHSRCIITEIRETVAHRYRALILNSTEDVHAEERSGAGMVSFYDTPCVGEPFYVRPKEHPMNPSWASELSTAFCIGICREGIYPKKGAMRVQIKETARGIINWFGPNYDEFIKIARTRSREERERYYHPRPMMMAQRL
jgi:hypothetical protein